MWLLLSLAFAAPADDVERALAARHAPPCEAVWALGAEDVVRGALIAAAAEGEQPPWAPLRAASCLVAHAPADAVALDAVVRLVANRTRPGVTAAVVHAAAAVDASTATRIAAALAPAVAHPDVAAVVASELRASPHDALRALVP